MLILTVMVINNDSIIMDVVPSQFW